MIKASTFAAAMRLSPFNRWPNGCHGTYGTCCRGLLCLTQVADTTANQIGFLEILLVPPLKNEVKVAALLSLALINLFD